MRYILAPFFLVYGILLLVVSKLLRGSWRAAVLAFVAATIPSPFWFEGGGWNDRTPRITNLRRPK